MGGRQLVAKGSTVSASDECSSGAWSGSKTDVGRSVIRRKAAGEVIVAFALQCACAILKQRIVSVSAIIIDVGGKGGMGSRVWPSGIPIHSRADGVRVHF